MKKVTLKLWAYQNILHEWKMFWDLPQNPHPSAFLEGEAEWYLPEGYTTEKVWWGDQWCIFKEGSEKAGSDLYTEYDKIVYFYDVDGRHYLKKVK